MEKKSLNPESLQIIIVESPFVRDILHWKAVCLVVVGDGNRENRGWEMQPVAEELAVH